MRTPALGDETATELLARVHSEDIARCAQRSTSTCMGTASSTAHSSVSAG